MTVPDILKKLNSPINEIKHRTLQSLELQLRMGMLDHLDVDIVVRLLHLLKSREAKSSDHLIRDILCKYCASRIGRESVITSGGMDIIAELENEGANEQEKQSWGVLRSILSEDQYLQIRTNPRDSSGYQFEVDNFESLRNQRLALFAPIEPTTEQQDHLNHFFALLQSTAAIEIFGEFKWICANVGCGIFLQHSKYLKDILVLLKSENQDLVSIGIRMVDMLVHEWNHRIDELVSNCEWGVAAKCDKGTKSFEITIFDAASLFMRPLLEISPGLRSPELAIVVRTLRNSLKFFKIGILDMIMLNLKKIEICIQIDHPFSCLINSGERYDHLWTVVKWDLACEYLSEVVPVIDGYDGVKSSYLSYIANDNSYLEKFCRYLLTLDCTSALPFYKCLLYLVNSTESLRTIVVSIEEWQKVRRIDDCELVPLLGAVLNLPLDIFQDDDTVNFRAKITSGLVKCTEPDLLRDYIPFLQVLKHIDSTLFMSILKKCEKQYPHIATECSIRDCLSRDSHTRLIAARGLAIREVDVDIISNLFAAITIPVEVPVDYSGLEGLTMAECRDKALILSSNLRDIDQFKHLLGILHFSLKPENLKVFSEFMEVIVSNLLMSFATLYQKGQVPFALLRCLVLLALHSPRSRKAMRDKTDFSYLLIQLCINKSIFFRLECGKLLSMLLLDVDSTSVKEVLDIIDLESTGAVIIPTSLTEKYIPFGVLRIVNRESIFESVLVSNSLILDSCKFIASPTDEILNDLADLLFEKLSECKDELAFQRVLASSSMLCEHKAFCIRFLAGNRHEIFDRYLYLPEIEPDINIFAKTVWFLTKLCVKVNSKTIRIKLNALINTIMPQIRSEKLHRGIEGILTHMLTELSSHDILDNPEDKFSNLLQLIIHSTISPDLINACFILARSVQNPDYISHLLVISRNLERLLISEPKSTGNQLPLIGFLFKLMKLWNYCEIFGELSITLMLQSDEIEIQNFACKILSFKIKEYSIQKLRDSSILNLVLECYRRVFILNNNRNMYFLPLNNALVKKNAVGGLLESFKCQDLAVIVAQQLDGTNHLQTLASCMCVLFNICLADPDSDSIFENPSFVETAIKSALNIYSPHYNSALITIISEESKAKYAEFSEVFTKTTIRYLALCLNHGKSVLLQNPRLFQSFMTCIAKNLDTISDSIDEFLELLSVILKSSPVCSYQLLDGSSLVEIAIESTGAESGKSRLAAMEALAIFLKGSKMYFSQVQVGKLCTELMKSLELQSTEQEFSASQRCFLILMSEISLSEELLFGTIIPRLELALNFSYRRPIWVFRALDILCSKYLNLRVIKVKKEKLSTSRMLQAATECIFSVTLRSELKPTIQFLQNYSSGTEVQRAILEQHRKFGAQSILAFCIERFHSEIDDLWTTVVELMTQISLNEELAMQISRINILSGRITHTLVRQKRYQFLNGALELCINLSKSHNGQSNLLKNFGFVDSVISIATVPNQQIQLSALRLLCSLMRFKGHRAYLFVNENIYANIAFILESNHASPRYFALQLVWILIYDCEKAKVCLKQSKLYPQLLNLTKKEKNKDRNLEEQQALSAINDLLH